MRVAAMGAGLRAHRVTSLPARAAWIARAVPRAPAPMTATLLIDEPSQDGRLAGLTISQPVEQGVQDRRYLRLEPEWRVDHQYAAAVEPGGIGRFAQAEFGGHDVAYAALKE